MAHIYREAEEDEFHEGDYFFLKQIPAWHAACSWGFKTTGVKYSKNDSKHTHS